MAEKIEIVTPVLRCASEEEVFFERLAEVTGLLDIIRGEATITLSVDKSVRKSAREDVMSICDMWHTTFRRVSE